jgi:hypothetical protein
MTDPKVKGDNAVPEMLDGTGAQALRNELDATRARLAEEQTAHATLRALWDARCGTIASVQARLTVAEGRVDAACFAWDEIALAALLNRTAAEARDWSRMTPREAWEHLRAAPKVAGPWEYGNRRIYATHIAAISFGVYGARLQVGGPELRRDYPSDPYPTRAEADAALRAAGWRLVDE